MNSLASRREPGRPARTEVYRTLVDLLRDQALKRSGRGPATHMPRPRVQERWRLEGSAQPFVGSIRALAARPLNTQEKTPWECAAFSELQDVVLRAVEDRPVVAFDIFNTLLLRSVEGEWLKTAVAYGLHRHLTQLMTPGRAPSLAEVRRRRLDLEMEIAGERVARGDDNEVDFEELMVRWVGTWVLRDPARARLAAEVRASELELERHALRAAPGVRQLIETLRARGKRVIFVSDMYLSAPVLSDLLAHCGLGGLFDAGYASIDQGRRKATGRLFPRVLELEQLRPEQLLFVGDDENSDNIQPNKLGIRSVRVVDPGELERRGTVEALQQAVEQNPFWSARYTEELMDRLERPALRRDGDVTYQIGRALAPSLVGFVLDVKEQCARLGIERVFFIAREGLTFLKIAHLLGDTSSGSATQDRYLFLSRASTILASMREFTWEELQRFWRQYNRQTLRDLLRNLSLPEDEFLPLAEACGITDADRVLDDPARDPGFERFLASRRVTAAFSRHRDHAREMLRRYLEYRGLMKQERVAMVDIGWKGSMQDNLVRAFSDDPEFPELHGFYVGYVEDGRPPAPRSYKYGYLADTRRRDLEEAQFFRNTAIFEMATTANHGSTVRFEPHPRIPSIPLPILVHHSLEKENSARYFRTAQQAIFDYARDFAAVRPLVPFSAEELKPGILSELIRFMRYPTRDEAEEFLRYSHVESFGVHEVTTFGFKVDMSAVLAHRNPRKMLGEIRRAFRRNMWREAVVKRTGVPLAAFVYDAWQAYKQVK